MNTGDVTFEMLEDDVNKTRIQLDNVRAKPTKFICINDNQKETSIEQFNLIRSFFTALWPIPSSFELKDGKINKILRYSEDTSKLKSLKPVSASIPESSFSLTIMILAFLVGFTLAYCFSSLKNED